MSSSPARARRWRVPLAAGAALLLSAAGVSAAAGEPRAAAGAEAACAADGFCEDFEGQTGTTPSGRWNTQVRDCSGSGTASVDASVAHEGSRSVRVDGGGGYCNHAFVGTTLDEVPAGSPLYVRFWINHETALPPDHVAFLAMQDTADNGRDLRMGGQNQALQWNRESDDATLPAQSPVGVGLSRPLPVGEWSCLEFQLDPSAGTLQTWLNGESVEGLIVDGTPTQDVDQQWLARGGWRPSLSNLRFGWESYGGATDTLWFDDIAVGTSRTGC
ncbi:polysaccharide lyase [Streptomyces hoynatensis]|uniref:polysaccharide lyase n=1 Tax=Streptomyces hoynatensis TaxID=1141874 RepID=UPI001F4E9E29|nr:polysaccharide lyase [Streptomyces hoynatensis]